MSFPSKQSQQLDPELYSKCTQMVVFVCIAVLIEKKKDTNLACTERNIALNWYAHHSWFKFYFLKRFKQYNYIGQILSRLFVKIIQVQGISGLMFQQKKNTFLTS